MTLAEALNDYHARLIHSHGVIGAGKVPDCERCRAIKEAERLAKEAASSPACLTCGWPIPCKCGPT